MKRLFIVALSAALAVSCSHNEQKVTEYTAPDHYQKVTVVEPDGGKVKNIIIMIGDGMGLEQLSTAWVANRGALNIDNIKTVGLQRTYCNNYLITDSAAAGTALATGTKTDKGHIATTREGEPLCSILKIAHQAGKRTGVAVTCRLNDATPATFCCHNTDRDQSEAIAADYVGCGVDYIAGGGMKYWRGRTDNRDLLAEMSAEGYTACTDMASLAAADKLPVVAVLADLELPDALERGNMFRDMAAKALELLSKDNDKGFVLMLEGSCIDDWCHANRIDKAVEEILDFDRTVGDVLQWAAEDGNTLVVVTADHSTGGLTLLDGDIATGRVSVNFSNEGHNGIAVPFYVFGACSRDFGGIMENSDLSGRLIGFLNKE